MESVCEGSSGKSSYQMILSLCQERMNWEMEKGQGVNVRLEDEWKEIILECLVWSEDIRESFRHYVIMRHSPNTVPSSSTRSAERNERRTKMWNWRLTRRDMDGESFDCPIWSEASCNRRVHLFYVYHFSNGCSWQPESLSEVCPT